jgi:hypothetical protein
MCLVCPQDLEYVQDQQCVCLLNSYLSLCVFAFGANLLVVLKLLREGKDIEESGQLVFSPPIIIR